MISVTYATENTRPFKEVGAFIKDMRVYRRLTQQQLADKTFVSPGHISRIETGKTLPSIELLDKLLETLSLELKVIDTKKTQTEV